MASYASPYAAQPSPEQIAAAVGGVDNAWNDYGAPDGWYPTGDTQWTQTPPAPVQAYDNSDGGGGGGAAPLLPPYDPATDPSYQQLLAQLGLKENSARALAAQRIGQIQTEGTIAGPRLQEAGIEQRRGISGNLENRGLFRSGERLRLLALQRRGEGERLADVARNTATGVANVNAGLEGQIQDIAAQRANADFEARLRAAS